jgi:hypothetical protein
MAYSPPLTLTGTLPVIPVIVAGADVVKVEGSTLLAAVKANASGVVSWIVVTWNPVVSVPTVTFPVTDVLLLAELVSLSWRVCPFEMVPLELVKAPPATA